VVCNTKKKALGGEKQTRDLIRGEYPGCAKMVKIKKHETDPERTKNMATWWEKVGKEKVQKEENP